jgi:hypothetical protein
MQMQSSFGLLATTHLVPMAVAVANPKTEHRQLIRDEVVLLLGKGGEDVL